jgi:hypothetical protein
VALSVWSAGRLRRNFREAATDRFSDTQPINWRPVWRLTWKIAAAIVLIIGAAWSARVWINQRGERALQAVLAAHPNFQLEEPPPTYIPDNLNLARWDFLNRLNESKIRQPENLDFIGVLDGWPAGVRYKAPPSNAPESRLIQIEDEQLRRLHAAARERPFLQFAPRAIDPTRSDGNFHNALHSICARLAARAERRLASGEHPLDDILLALRFANCLTNDPLALPFRNRAVMCLIQPVYDGILKGGWTDSELQRIQEAFTQSSARGDFEAWQHRSIRDVVEAVADQPRTSAPFGPRYILVGNMPHYIGQPPPERRLPGKIKAQQAEFIDFGLSWGNPESSRASWQAAHKPNDEFRDSLFAALDFNLRRANEVYIPFQTRLDEVAVACAIERFRLSNGSLPKILDELKPQFLSTIPKDLKVAGPLKYHRTENGYVLYSVGQDGVDNGGVPEKIVMVKGRHPAQEGDWVWIYKK